MRSLGGLDNVGGESFDALLYAHVGKEIARRDGSVWDSLQEPPDMRWRRAGEDLYREVRRAKEDLSKYPSVTLDTGGLLGAAPLQLTRDELEAVLRPKIESTARELIDTIGRAGQRPADLAAVYLAGGSSRMPLVERVVSDALGATARVLGEPKSVVAIGAAKWSADVRVDIKPAQASRRSPEHNAILPTVPAEQRTRIVALVAPPQAGPQPIRPPEPTPVRPPMPAYSQPPAARGPQVGPNGQPGPQPQTRRQPASPYGQQWQPPRTRSRTGLVVGLVALALTAVLAVVAVVWAATSPTDPTAAPANLRATATEDAVNLEWDAVSGADHYTVYRDGSVVGSEVSRTTFVDRSGNFSKHNYQVTSVVNGTESERSKILSAAVERPPSPSPSPDNGLTAAQQALVDRLPPAVVDVDSCKPYPAGEDPKFTDAAVACSPARRTSTVGTAPAVIYIGHDRSPSVYQEDVEALAKRLTLPARSCLTPPAETTWFLKRDPATTIGDLYCFTRTDGKAIVQWHYDDDQIWMRAEAADSTVTALMAWWRDLSNLVLR